MKTIGISLGFYGKLHKDVYKAWKSLDKNFKINYIKKRSTHPHITLIAGKTKDIKKIHKVLLNLKIKRFKLRSPGLGIFANKNPNLYIRWERNLFLMKCFKKIRNKTKKLFYTQRKYYDLSSWIPKSSVAWVDFKYSQMKNIQKKINYLFKSHNVIINRIYLIEVTDREILRYSIKI